MKRPTKGNILYALLMLVMIGIFALLAVNTLQENKERNMPVDVLEDFKISVPADLTYNPGGQITTTTHFKKLVNVTGSARRYIQCYKPGTKVWDGYILINSSQGTSAPTKNGTATSTVGIPTTIVGLPNTCRLYFTVVYNVNKYHPAFSEAAYSNNFTVSAKPVDPSQTVSEQQPTVIYTDNPTAFIPSNQVNSIAPFANPNDNSQLIIVKPNDNPTMENSKPARDDRNFLERTLDSVFKSITSIF